ncbi:hypothetical protein CC78DRAFT_578366 [Lojkania enalia]|uniref:Uncharacterized protein n=1 Tax=Lojkania enalia TaxID=147567 RepID=A0A9P4KHL7_9PLEO|nr:hypothetical protein CC78DRAFT_578366 [Didymosphaeria enalia]
MSNLSLQYWSYPVGLLRRILLFLQIPTSPPTSHPYSQRAKSPNQYAGEVFETGKRYEPRVGDARDMTQPELTDSERYGQHFHLLSGQLLATQNGDVGAAQYLTGPLINSSCSYLQARFNYPPTYPFSPEILFVQREGNSGSPSSRTKTRETISLVTHAPPLPTRFCVSIDRFPCRVIGPNSHQGQDRHHFTLHQRLGNSCTRQKRATLSSLIIESCYSKFVCWISTAAWDDCAVVNVQVLNAFRLRPGHILSKQATTSIPNSFRDGSLVVRLASPVG